MFKLIDLAVENVEDELRNMFMQAAQEARQAAELQ